jgi:hypothetical protein
MFRPVRLPSLGVCEGHRLQATPATWCLEIKATDHHSGNSHRGRLT